MPIMGAKAKNVVNLDAGQGEDFDIFLNFKDSNGYAVDITGWKLSLTIKDKISKPDSSAAFQLDVTTHADALNGVSGFHLPHLSTKDLDGIYQYDIQAVAPGNQIKTIMRGTFRFDYAITQRNSLV